MNLDKILDNNEYWTRLEDSKNVAYYSLVIVIDEYFTTYHSIYLQLNSCSGNNRNYINSDTKEVVAYIRCYLNIAIHIQHFFELETKRILENEHLLYAVDDKGDPIILSKLINNESLDATLLAKLKSVEFSEAISRLKKLVDNGVINDSVATIFVRNYKLLTALNQLRNTIIHRGKRIMKYCDLDDFFATNLLPVIKEVIECDYYKSILFAFKEYGYYDAMCEIIKEGQKSTPDYSKIAYEKELAHASRMPNNRTNSCQITEKLFAK